MCYGKSCLKIFIVSIPKEGLMGLRTLVMTLTLKLYPAAFTYYILKSMSHQKKEWRGPARQILHWRGHARQSFFLYGNYKDLKARFPMT